jgi:hypothetical protein
VPKRGGGESFPELYINKPDLAREALAGAGACAQQPGMGKLVRVVERGKLTGEDGNPPPT